MVINNTSVNEPNVAAHPMQRVGIFIDTQNLYHSAKSKHRSNVNYDELIRAAVNGRQLIRAFAYVIKSEEHTEEKFFDALEDIGIEIRVKDLQVFHTGVKKADWDVGIAVDMIRLTEKLDVVVLASGDGDFIEVIRYCQSRGVRVEVMAFEKTSNAALMDEADFYVDLGGDNGKYLLSSRKSYNRGPLSRGAKPTSVSSSNVDSFLAAKPLSNAAPANNYNKPAYTKKAEEVPNVFKSKSAKRKVRKVTGLPARKSKPSGTPRTNPRPGFSSDNFFGNAPPQSP